MTDTTDYCREELQRLIDEHGVDNIARLACVTPRTVLEYAGKSRRTLPLTKLENLKRLAELPGVFEHKNNVG